jgi:hypothetical protein
MMHILFCIFAIIYYLQLWLVENFNPIGKEFTNLVILGLLAILLKKDK